MSARDLPRMPLPYAAAAEEKKIPKSILVDLDQIEDSNSLTVEVISVWMNTVFNVKHLGGKKPVYSIGEQPDCDFWIPSDRLGGHSKVPLVDTKGVLYLNTPFLGGEIILENGDIKSLKDVESGNGTYQIPGKARCKLNVGEITFHVNSVPRPKKPGFPLGFDWAMQTFTGVSFGIHVIFLFLIFFFAPDSKLISAENFPNFGNNYVKYLITPHDKIPESQLPEWMKEKPKMEKSEGDAGKKHKGDAGKMGDVNAKKTKNRYGIKGDPDNPDPHMARDQNDVVSKAGIIAVLKQNPKMPTSPFGRDTAGGTDAGNALGALLGHDIGPNWGIGGFAMYGTGKGGGGDGEGTIGVGELGTIGSYGGHDKGKQWNPGIPKLKKAIKSHGPKINHGTAGVIGSLSKAEIRRVIRQHINEVKYCYEKQLAVKEDLAGRVSIKFVIAPNGVVKSAKIADSTLGSSAVEKCVAAAVERWTFPAPPDGGYVVVTYPFILEPAAGN